LAHKGVFTNTAPVDAYRGAGRPEACYVVERLVDRAAREMKIDPTELRRRNFVANDAFPYTTRVALTYDSGDYFKTLDMVVEAADYAGFEQRRQEAASRGKLRGIGVATYIEACAMAPSVLAGQLGARAGFYESAEVRVHPTGSITVFTGAHSHGQGHETTFAQLVSERLGLAFDQIDIVHGDTAKIPFGMGTYASRSLAVGGTALVKAMDKIVNKGKKIAAHMLEAAEADIEFADGKFAVAGTERCGAQFYREKGREGEDEIDLILTFPSQKDRLVAIEFKAGPDRSAKKGFYSACAALGVRDRFIVHSGDAAHIGDPVDRLDLKTAIARVAEIAREG
jgi:carbon-monoxide dehydrogenase large subunit